MRNSFQLYNLFLVFWILFRSWIAEAACYFLGSLNEVSSLRGLGSHGLRGAQMFLMIHSHDPVPRRADPCMCNRLVQSACCHHGIVGSPVAFARMNLTVHLKFP